MDPAFRLYTVDEANRTLPLVRSIVADIAEKYAELEQQRLHLVQLQTRVEGARGRKGEPSQDDLDREVKDFEEGVTFFNSLIEELSQLGVELKDPRIGLIDFRSFREDRVVYLCWRLGEGQIEHWHELDAGFSGRQLLEQPEVALMGP